MAFLLSVREGLTAGQAELYWAILTFVAGFRGDPLVKFVDEDLADGAAALAATFETADRGLIYEHRPQSLAAQRFVTDLKAFLAGLAAEGGAPSARKLERDAAVVLRHLERGARGPRAAVDQGPSTALDTILRAVNATARHGGPNGDEPVVEPPRPLLVRP